VLAPYGEEVSAPVKECRCGRRYLSWSWAELPLVGYLPNGQDAAGEVLELRNCACGSTIAMNFGDVPSLPPLSCEHVGR